MHVSVNELTLVSQKAALGAGVTEGAAEDLGNAAVWLGLRGFSAVEAVHDALLGARRGKAVYGNATLSGPRVQWGPVQTGRALSAAMVGGAAADLFSLVRKAEGGFACMRELDVPLLQLAGFAKSAGKLSSQTIVRWFNRDSEIAFCMQGGSLRILAEKGTPYAGGPFQFEASCQEAGWRVDHEKSIPEVPENNGMYLYGYEVDEKIWYELKQLADLILVEPTERSRALGARPGLTDND